MNLQNSTKEELLIELEKLNQRFNSIFESYQKEKLANEQATAALEASNAKLTTTLESMNDAVFVSDVEGNFNDFNEAFATFHKFKNKEECAKTLKEYPLFLDVYKSDGVLASLEEWAVPRALRGETATNQEYTLHRKDTGETWVGSYSLAPIRDKSGHIVGSVVTGRDITAQKQAEEKIKELNTTLEKKVKERTIQLSEELDIRKHTETALMESQANLLAVFNATTESVFLVSADSHLIAINDIAVNRLGQSADSLIGKNVYDILPPNVAENRRPFINQVLTTCKPVTFEDERDGRWVINFIYPILDESGKVSRMAVFSRDISDRKKAEETIRESETLYRLITENATDVIWVRDLETYKFRYISPSFERLFGYSAEYAMTNGLENVLTPSSLAYISKAIPDRIERFKNGFSEIYTDELEHIHKNGSIVWVRINTQIMLNPTDGKLEATGVAHDITERKRTQEALAKSEYKYRMMFENMTEGFSLNQIITNKKGEPIDFRILETNKAFEKHTGLRPEEIIGKSIREIMTQADESQIKKYGKVAQTGEPLQYDYYSKTFNRHIRVTAFCPQSGQFATIFEDISERKLAELALEESEKRFKDLFLKHNSIMLIVDPETGLLLDANQSAVNFYGYSHSQLQTMNIADINTLPKDQVKENYKKAIKEENNSFVFPHRLADGSERIVEVHSTPINISNKKILFSIIHDITDRKKLEQSLLDSEEKYRNIFATEKDSLFLIDEESYSILEVNDSACKLYGYTRDEMLNLKNYDLSAQPAETKRLTREIKERIDLRNHKKKDGTIFPVDISATRFTLKGKPILLAAIRDISALKQTEEDLKNSIARYDKLTSTISVGVYVLISKLDGTLAFEYVSSKLTEIIGVDIESLKADAFLLIKFIHPDDKEFFMKLVKEGFRMTMQQLDWKGRFVVDGKIKWLNIISTPEMLENGDILRQGLVIDITESVLAKAEIERKNDELAKSLSEKDKFFSIIAHDLRNPFNTLLGFTEMLDEDLQTMSMDQIQDIATILRNSSTNVFNLVENLLEWSRLQRGITSFNPEQFFLVLKIKEILQPVLEQSSKKGIKIEYAISEKLMVFADENMISSIIRNLGTNAVKFTPKGGLVNISARENNNTVEISVTDNGIGMNSSMIEKLFKLTEDISRKGTDKEPSTGLGLILCKEFVEKHGGNIWVESEEGKGSTFYFSLPLSQD